VTSAKTGGQGERAEVEKFDTLFLSGLLRSPKAGGSFPMKEPPASFIYRFD